MKRIIIFLLLVAVIGGVAYWQMTDDSRIGAWNPKNATYQIEGVDTSLSDGSLGDVAMFGEPTYGDLNGDGTNDAGVVLVRASEGSGTFYYITAAIYDEGKWYGTNSFLMGDRIAPQTVEIRDGILIANYAERNPGEPFTTRPSRGVSRYLRLIDGALTEVEQP